MWSGFWGADHVNGLFIKEDLEGLSDFRRDFVQGDYDNLSPNEESVCLYEYVLYLSENKESELVKEWNECGMTDETISQLSKKVRGGRVNIK